MCCYSSTPPRDSGVSKPSSAEVAATETTTTNEAAAASATVVAAGACEDYCEHKSYGNDDLPPMKYVRLPQKPPAPPSPSSLPLLMFGKLDNMGDDVEDPIKAVTLVDKKSLTVAAKNCKFFSCIS